MTNQGPPQDFFFRASGVGNAGWEIGRPQPAIIQLSQRGVFRGKVLDIGCGIGDNAIYIAQHSKDAQITAIDMVPRAINVAREKAEQNNARIQFEVVNMLDDLSKTKLEENSFDVILDSAIFHVFSDADRPTYMKNIRRLLKPMGVYVQLVFSEKETRPTLQVGPRRVQKAELMEIFSSHNGWTIESIEETHYEARSDTGVGGDAQAYLSFIRKTA